MQRSIRISAFLLTALGAPAQFINRRGVVNSASFSPPGPWSWSRSSEGGLSQEEVLCALRLL